MEDKRVKETAAAPEPIKESPGDAIIEAWFLAWFGASDLSRATDAYKLVFRAKDDLKARFSQGG